MVQNEDNTSEDLHRKLDELIQEYEKQGIPNFSDLSVSGARTLHDELLAINKSKREPIKRVRDIEISGPNGPIPVRVYEPDTSGSRPIFVYFHGGGWMFGPTGGHDHLCRAIAKEGSCTVVSVDYRLAPEHPFPMPLKDCYAATKWVASHPDLLDGDVTRLALGGGSSGGNLAAATCLLARDNGTPSVAHQFLIYPVLDHNFETKSYKENGEGYLLTKTDMQWFWNNYVEDPVDKKNPYASPLQVRDASDLPPTSIIAAGFDPLQEENARYADRLSKAGVPVEYRLHEDMVHGFLPMLEEPVLDASCEEVKKIGSTIKSL